MKKNYLFTPGPCMVPPEAQLEEAAPLIHHRTAQFSRILEEAAENLKKVFCTEQVVYLIAGSGTAAMEASVANICSSGDEALCVVGGKFGERWSEICKAYGCETVALEIEWGRSINPEDVKAALRSHPRARALFITQSETSTGALTDVEAIAALTRETDTLLVVDAVSSAVIHALCMDAWGVDVVVSGSQKGCMIPPGLAFIAVSNRAWDAVEKCTSPRYYLDLRKMRKQWEKSTTPYTPPISLVRALNKSLEILLAEGLENVSASFALMAQATRAAAEAMGLELVAERPANSVTAVYGPEGVDTGELVKLMRDSYGVTIAGGQEQFKGKIFRVGHMGYVTEEDLLIVIGTLEKALKELGYEFQVGAGVAAAQKVLV